MAAPCFPRWFPLTAMHNRQLRLEPTMTIAYYLFLFGIVIACYLYVFLID